MSVAPYRTTEEEDPYADVDVDYIYTFNPEDVNTDWEGYYIDYQGLQKQLRAMMHELVTSEAAGKKRLEEFCHNLDREIDKCVCFYEMELTSMTSRLNNLREYWKFLSPKIYSSLYMGYKDLAEGLTELLKFVQVNAAATRKILIKCQKKTAFVGLPQEDLLHQYLKSRLRPDAESRLDQLRARTGLDIVVTEIETKLSELRVIANRWISEGRMDPHTEKQLAIDQRRRRTTTLMYSFRGEMAKTQATTGFLQAMARQAEIEFEGEPVGQGSFWGLFLNNYNTFLYMANYYIVIPTANQYSSILGMSSTMSGMILSMAPLSACVSAVLYSVWSNYNFRAPLLFSTLLLVIGNILYSLALPYNSASLLFIGRLLVGFGGNRAVNRRYIADFVPMDQRTKQSAVFVAVGSIGMTLGPGCQYFLNMIDFNLPIVGWPCNHITASGYIMAILWVIFALQIIVQFDEPERRYAKKRGRSVLEPLLEPIAEEEGQVIGKPPKKHDLSGPMICLWVYFVLKGVLEAFQGAAPLVTGYHFGWSDAAVGNMLAVIGIIVIPSNLLVGISSNFMEDRVAQQITMVTLAIACAAASVWVPAYFNIYIYLLGGLFIFVSAQMLEGVNMGLLSKVMPKELSKGLMNSGFLSTEAGTFGRVVGNCWISVAGLLGPVAALENLILFPSMALVIFTILLCACMSTSLIPIAQRMKQESGSGALKDELERWLKKPDLAPRPAYAPVESGGSSDPEGQTGLTVAP